MKITGSHLMAKALKAEGINNVFTLAGDHILHVMDVMADDDFTFIDTRHEQAAVHMANAWSQINNGPAVSMFTTPGIGNAVAGLTMAYHTNSPIINIVGCAASTRLGTGASQELDQVGLATPVTKGAWLVTDPYRIPEFVSRAFRTALSDRRGPVHLTVPVDFFEAEVDVSKVQVYKPQQYRHIGRLQGDPSRIKEAIELLQTAKKPAVIVGDGAYTVSPSVLQRFIDVTHVALLADVLGRGMVPDTHPSCFGTAATHNNDAAVKCLKDADVVLLLGKKLDATLQFGEPPTMNPNVKLIQVEPSSYQIALGGAVDVIIQGDVGSVLDQLTAESENYKWTKSSMLSDLETVVKDQKQKLDAMATTGSPLHAMSVHKAMLPFLDDSTYMVFEGSDFALFGAAYYDCVQPNRFFGPGTLGMLGWSLPFALGAQLALPNEKVVMFTGDGAFGFSGMELDTAVRHNLPVVVIVGNDSVWGIDYHQQVRLYGKTVATELLPTRYDKVAEGLGAHSEYVETSSELPGALQRAFSANRPALVNVRIIPAASPATESFIKAKVEDYGDN